MLLHELQRPRLLPIHVAQVITYLRLSAIPVALRVTFNVREKEGCGFHPYPPFLLFSLLSL